MINGNENNSSQDNRGIFTRFLSPLWQGITNKANIHNGILRGISKEVGKTLDDMIDSKKESWLDTASGSFLDHWGEFVGVRRRLDEDDETYRARIKKYIMVLRGTIPAIKDALKDYFGDDSANISVYEPHVDIFYLNKSLLNGGHKLQGDYYRYAVIDVSIDRAFDYDELMSIIDRFKPAGVIVYVTHNPSLNKNIGILTEFHDMLSVTPINLEVQTLTGYGSVERRQLTLATSELIPDKDIFYTNNSKLNSLDVLAGSPLRGRPSIHRVFTMTDSEFYVEQDTPIEGISDGGGEVDSMVYTATAFSGGARAVVDVADGESLYTAMNIGDYYALNDLNKFNLSKMKYIKVLVESSKSGLDIGYMEAVTQGDLLDVAGDAEWMVPVDGQGGYNKYPNGRNIVNPLDRRSYATLSLDDAYPLHHIGLEHQYGSGSVGSETPLSNDVVLGIYGSEDGEAYQTIYHGLTNGRTTFPIVRGLNLEEGWQSQISATYSDYSYINYFDVSNNNEGSVFVEIYDFYDEEWKVISETQSAHVKLEIPLSEVLPHPSNSERYCTLDGTVLTRVRPVGGATLSLDYFSLGVSFHRGFDYTLDYSMKVSASRPTNLLSTGLLSLRTPQVYVEGELSRAGKYKTPFKMARLQVTPTGIDPNLGKYFKLSPTEDATSSSPDEGFDAGLLAGEFTSTAGTGVSARISRIGKEDVIVPLTLSEEYATLDLYGWATDITKIVFTGASYAINSITVPNYRKTTPFKPVNLPDGLLGYELGSEFFKDFFPFSKTNFGESLDPYEDNPDIFVTSKSEHEHAKSVDCDVSLVGNGEHSQEPL